MANLSFFFTDKQRLKFLIKCILIGMPILLLVGWGLNYYEDSEAEKGTANDKGGMNYFYRESSGMKEYPEPVARLLPLYPNGQSNYLNISTDKNNELEGNIIVFTPDELGKVIAFYKTKGKVIEETGDGLVFEKNGQNITISKENVYSDDPVKDETKFEVRFNTRATVDKWKNYKP